MLSDLRESGCVTADTRVMRADTNAEVTIGELMESGARDIPVWALDDRLKLVPRTMTHAFPSGVKDVYELTLASGRTIRATANHPFLTYDGWKPWGSSPRARGSAWSVTCRLLLVITPRDDHEVALLAHLIGDGSFVQAPADPLRQPGRGMSRDGRVGCLAPVRDHRGPRRARRGARDLTSPTFAPYHLTHGRAQPDRGVAGRDGALRAAQPREVRPRLGLRATQGADRTLPSQPLGHRRLRALSPSAGQGRIFYASTSRRLVDDVAKSAAALQRVHAGSRWPGRLADRDGYHLHVTGAENQLRFLEEIGVHGQRSKQRRRSRQAPAQPSVRTRTSTPSRSRCGTG